MGNLPLSAFRGHVNDGDEGGGPCVTPNASR